MPNPLAKIPPGSNRRVTPLGEPLAWDVLEIEQRAQVSESDKLAAMAFWRRHSLRPFRDLLEAKERKPRKVG